VSPNWSAILAERGGGAPIRAAAHTIQAGHSRRFILMTDGDFNYPTHHRAKSSFRRRRTCATREGVTVEVYKSYTVGFPVPSSVQKTGDWAHDSRICATKPCTGLCVQVAHNGDELTAAYQFDRTFDLPQLRSKPIRLRSRLMAPCAYRILNIASHSVSYRLPWESRMFWIRVKPNFFVRGGWRLRICDLVSRRGWPFPSVVRSKSGGRRNCA